MGWDDIVKRAELVQLKNLFKEKISLVSDEAQFNLLVNEVQDLREEKKKLIEERNQLHSANVSLLEKISVLESDKSQKEKELIQAQNDKRKLGNALKMLLEQLGILKKETTGYQRIFDSGWSAIVKVVESFEVQIKKKTNGKLASLKDSQQKVLAETKKECEKQIKRMEESHSAVLEQMKRQLRSEREDSESIQEGLSQSIDALKKEIFKLSQDKHKASATNKRDLSQLDSETKPINSPLGILNQATSSFGPSSLSSSSQFESSASKPQESAEKPVSISENPLPSLQTTQPTKTESGWEEQIDNLEEATPAVQKPEEETKDQGKAGDSPNPKQTPVTKGIRGGTIGMMNSKISSDVPLEDELDLDSIQLPEKKPTGLIVKKGLIAKKKT